MKKKVIIIGCFIIILISFLLILKNKERSVNVENNIKNESNNSIIDEYNYEEEVTGINVYAPDIYKYQNLIEE